MFSTQWDRQSATTTSSRRVRQGKLRHSLFVVVEVCITFTEGELEITFSSEGRGGGGGDEHVVGGAIDSEWILLFCCCLRISCFVLRGGIDHDFFWRSSPTSPSTNVAIITLDDFFVFFLLLLQHERGGFPPRLQQQLSRTVAIVFDATTTRRNDDSSSTTSWTCSPPSHQILMIILPPACNIVKRLLADYNTGNCYFADFTTGFQTFSLTS